MTWGSSLRQPVVESYSLQNKKPEASSVRFGPAKESRLRESSLTSGNSWSKWLKAFKSSKGDWWSNVLHPCPKFFPMHLPAQCIPRGAGFSAKMLPPSPCTLLSRQARPAAAQPVTHTLYGSRGSDVSVILKDTFDLRERARRCYGRVGPRGQGRGGGTDTYMVEPPRTHTAPSRRPQLPRWPAAGAFAAHVALR